MKGFETVVFPRESELWVISELQDDYKQLREKVIANRQVLEDIAVGPRNNIFSDAMIDLTQTLLSIAAIHVKEEEPLCNSCFWNDSEE